MAFYTCFSVYINIDMMSTSMTYGFAIKTTAAFVEKTLP